MGAACVTESDLSVAWLRAFAHAAAPGISSLDPLVVTVRGFSGGTPIETTAIRARLDDALRESHSLQNRPGNPLTCTMVASTIFPDSLWGPTVGRTELYQRYLRLLPRIKRDARNRRGLYFERLINYGRGPNEGNQLEHIITAFRSGVKRTSAFQASICDPERDTTRMPMQGFPCLQQIAVCPQRSNGTLTITAFYGTQYIFQRAYGNYLGLCRLGCFLAREMDLELTQMTCVASHALLGEGITRERARNLVRDALERAQIDALEN